MITLFTFGPHFGLPDPSPFVTKAEVLLKMSGLPYRTDQGGFRRAPKGKLPYIEDAGTLVADSTFIRWHLEKKYGVDFDKGLSAPERATAWAFEKLCEEHLYWAVLESRWMNDRNFDRGPRQFFNVAPAPVQASAGTAGRRSSSSRPMISMRSPPSWATSPISWATRRAERMRPCSPSSPARFARCSSLRSMPARRVTPTSSPTATAAWRSGSQTSCNRRRSEPDQGSSAL